MAQKEINKLRMIAWEMTRSCNLSCAHCRASSEKGPYPGELSTEECFKVIDDIASFASPTIILTGGEPLLREDIFQIAEYGRSKALAMVMAPNGTLLTRDNVKKIIASGIKRISISLDGPDAASHDSLRGVPGAFEDALRGINIARECGLEFQINSTITKRNVKSLHDITKLAKYLGAATHDVFLLVPTGRGRNITDDELSPAEYEDALKILSSRKTDFPLDIKVTCAPHFSRILLQSHSGTSSPPRGRACMGGVSFCFISNVGELQPCGYLELKCGNVRELGFKKAWLESEVFNNLRDLSKHKGKCGVCEFIKVCGGCRARAYEKYNDYLAEEPHCIYEPVGKTTMAKNSQRIKH